MTVDPPTLVLGLERDLDPSSNRPTGDVPVLFGLSLATALPPMAMLPPPGVVLPTFRSGAHAILDPAELTAVLGRPTMEVWHGRVALGEVDVRLRGLEILLSGFQVIDESSALVCLGAITADSLVPDTGGATPSDLWDLACQGLERFGIASERPSDLGDDAFLVVYGGVTAQVAWLAGDRLATASVTCLALEHGWATKAACSIAQVLDRRLSNLFPGTRRHPRCAAALAPGAIG